MPKRKRKDSGLAGPKSKKIPLNKNEAEGFEDPEDMVDEEYLPVVGKLRNNFLTKMRL